MPAIPYETLSMLQETSDTNDSLDYFQSINFEIPQIIQEIAQSNPDVVGDSIDYETEDLDDIPDMEDFENQNLLVTDDPVNLTKLKCY